ncbi:MAG: exodeoxyribonuclease V beta subunit [Alteromonadaceae bacterium]|jgi:exodeoxyribonuclease V beta subunit
MTDSKLHSKQTARVDFDVVNVALSGANLVEASAGTGKTWSSTGLYLRMIVEKQLLPEHILVVTFTRAATAELAGRIRSRLQDMLLFLRGDKQVEDADLYADLQNKWSQQGQDFSAIQKQLQLAISEFDKAAIYTIHSFCQRLLNDYSFEASTRFDLKPITDETPYRQQVSEDFWRKQIGQLDAGNEGDQTWLSYLIEKKQSPSSLLKSVEKHLGKHSFVSLNVPELPVLQGDEKQLYQQALSVWQADQADIMLQFNQAFDDALNGSTYRKAQKDQYLDALYGLLDNQRFNWCAFSKKCSAEMMKSKVKKGKDSLLVKHSFFILLDEAIALDNQQQEIFAVKLNRLRAELLVYLESELPKLKSELGLLGFNDMMQQVYDALVGPNGQILASAVSGQFKAAIIDEFQDTDPLQLKVFDTLFVKENAILFYVGDPKQAIYSFRGADIYAYFEAAKKTINQYTLRTNYRSTPALVNSVNAIFATDHDAFISQDIHFDWVKSINKATLEIKDDQDSAVTFVLVEKDDGKPFSRTEADPLSCRYTAAKIAEILRKAQKGQANIVKGSHSRPIEAGDFAILVPSHRDGDSVKKELDALNIASVRHSKEKVLSSVAATTLLRLMQAVSAPSHEANVVALLGDALMGAQAQSIYELKHNDQQWEQLLVQFWSLREMWIESGFSSMFRCWLEQIDSSGHSVAQRLMTLANGERYLTDLMHLSEIIQSLSGELGSMQGLVAWLERAISEESDDDEYQLRLESDNKRVKIVTIHASKGLEYNIVFCPFIAIGKDPKSDEIVSAHHNGKTYIDFSSDDYEQIKQRQQTELLMEQIRLLYVALTRPVFRLYLNWPNIKNKTDYAALAWLIYADQNMVDDAVISLASTVKALSFEQFSQSVLDLQSRANKGDTQQGKVPADISVHIISYVEMQSPLNLVSSDAEQLISASLPKQKIAASWWQSSFSGLTKGQQAHSEEHNEEVVLHNDELKAADSFSEESEDSDTQDPYSIFELPRGAMTGEALHGIFEFWDYQKQDDDALSEMILQQLTLFNVGKSEDRHHWLPAVMAMVKSTIETPLDNDHIILSKMPAFQRLPEMEFLLSGCTQLSEITTLIGKPEYNLPSEFVYACKQLDNKQIEGYLTGFIDLVFEDKNGRFHVLDWKSNHLGMHHSDYHKQAMAGAMAHSHYYLQAILYLVALHRHLKNTLQYYDANTQLGDAWYLFIRGINGEKQQGIYHFTPPVALICAIDNALSPVHSPLTMENNL